ncbi:MAG: porin family protein [Balneolaceae bacterium]|nr:MAG: porin family protein [Balneolaceae bacterium]
MKLIIAISTIILFLLPVKDHANAQFAIGASYEIRDEYPTNGFGVRLEKGLLGKGHMLDLGIRGHFSYFNETNNLSIGDGATISRDMDVYDYGLAALLGIRLGIVKPYVGAGVGLDRFKQSTEREQLSFKENNFYWNAFGGAEFTLIPVVSPFIEYRISQFTGTEDLTFDKVNRIAFGIYLRF